jgi:glycosyl-4,4'-diaponeurosporenoate acyltransferase
MIIEVTSIAGLIISNSVGWFLVVFFTGFVVQKIPVDLFDYHTSIFRTFPWERRGTIYESVLKIKKWKDIMPEGGGVFKNGFGKRQAAERDFNYLETFARETCRAELVHWIIILALPLFFIWNPPVAVLIMVPIVLAGNIPCIIIQRYNRPRLVRMLEIRRRHAAG